MLYIGKFVRASLGAALLSLAAAGHAAEPVTLTHVHGLAYSADGKQLMIPSHDGLAVYGDSGWSKAAGPAHDYMGFSATRGALYSSGHPAPGSGMPNPFGLIKSSDGGKTWQKLGFEGESDFHLMATGHASNAVYIVNPAPNSRMKAPGLYYTVDDGRNWQLAAARGLQGRIAALAVHPSNPVIVAAGTTDGLYLSRDSGQRFDRIGDSRRVVGLQFDLEGRHLWLGTFSGKPGLARLELKDGAKPEEIALPQLNEDAVAYIAQNPARREEMAIATFKRSVYISPASGRTWTQIASDGKGKGKGKGGER